MDAENQSWKYMNGHLSAVMNVVVTDVDCVKVLSGQST